MSRQIFDSGGGEIVSTLHLGWSNARALALEVVQEESPVFKITHELVIAICHAFITIHGIIQGRAV